MKTIFRLAVVAMLLHGCKGPDKAFIAGVDALWQVVGPEYQAYVSEDSALSQEEKDIRLASASSMDKLIAEAQK